MRTQSLRTDRYDTFWTAGLQDLVINKALEATLERRAEMDQSGASGASEIVLSLNLATWAAPRAITVSSFTFHLTVPC
jgi:hypothetical protein